MRKLEAVEVCEIGMIQVNGVKGKNLFDAAKECIHLANLLKVAVKLYWNGEYINIYKNDTLSDVFAKVAKEDMPICKSCKRPVDEHYIPETGLCSACFTSHA